MQASERHQHRGRKKIGEKSPISLVRLATQNFNDLQRTQRYQHLQSNGQSPVAIEEEDSSPRQKLLPNLKPQNRWVSLDAVDRRTLISQADAHQIQFQDSGRETFKERVSLDYSKIEQLMRRQRKNIKSTRSTQEEILNLVKQQKSDLNNTIVLASKTPKMRNLQFSTMYNVGSANLFSNEVAVDSTSGQLNKEVPAHFEYPETDMSMTCNYFGPNDYMRKKTIKDLRLKVIEERSTKKNKDKLDKQYTSLEDSKMSCEGSIQNSWVNKKEFASKVRKLNRPSKLMVAQSPSLHGWDQDSQEDTPEGCKGVQIDSSFTHYDPEEDLYKQLDQSMFNMAQPASKLRNQYNQTEKQSPKVKMSTKLFNGDYLQNQINQIANPSKQTSPTESRGILPSRVLQEDVNDSKKQTKKCSKSKASPQKKIHQMQQFQNQNKPAHQLTYYAGPQINQINLHVHFNGPNHGFLPQELAVKHNVEAHITKPEQNEDVFMAQSQKMLAEQGSKQTLNQSSSKALPNNNQQNNLTQNQQFPSNRKDNTPFDLRPLNKYSSLQTQNLLTNETPSGRREDQQQLKNIKKNETTTSGEIRFLQTKTDQSILGIDLNSMNSSKSLRRIQEIKNNYSIGINEENKKNLDLLQVSPQQSLITEQQKDNKPIRTTVNTKVSQESQVNSQQMKDIPAASLPQQTIDGLTQAVPPGNVFFQQTGDKQQTENVINQLIQQLQQQQRSATIKITTQGSQSSTLANNVSPKIPFISSIVQNQQNNFSAKKQQQPLALQSPLEKASVFDKSSISGQKQKKMRRNNQYRSSTNEPRGIPQLYIYKMIAKKMSGIGASDHFSQRLHNSQQRQMSNTMQGGFSPHKMESNFDQQMRQTQIVQASMTKDLMLESQNGHASTSQRTTGPNHMMNNTIAALPGERWNSLDLDQTARQSQFNPFQTGFTQMTDKKEELTNMHRGAHIERTMYRSLQADRDRPGFSLETKPEMIAQSNGESTVLFKVNPVGNVGRFRPRAKRQKETFAERNSRLGHLAHRTSVGVIQNKMKHEVAQQPQRLIPDSPLDDTLNGFSMNPMMLQTDSTFFSKRAMERELTDLEQTIVITPTDTLEAQSPQEKGVQQSDGDFTQHMMRDKETFENYQLNKEQKLNLKNQGTSNPNVGADQVIYEESIAEFDDAESHISGTMTTFPSHQTARLLQPSRNSAMKNQLDSNQASTLRGQDRSQQRNDQQEFASKVKSILGPQHNNNGQKIDTNNLQTIMGSLNQRISYDQMLLSKIKTISAAQQKLPQASPPQKRNNQQNNSRQSRYQNQTIQNFQRASNQIVVGVLEGTKVATRSKNKGKTGQGIAPYEVLEGQSILALKQNSQWNMLPSAAGHSLGESPKVSPRRFQNLNSSRHMNQSHIVVVQTPEATPNLLRSKEDLKQKLDIKIRCPSQLLLPEVIEVINKKLDLTISLIYFDGSQPLSSIKNGLGAKYIRHRVPFSQHGFVIHSEKNGVSQTKLNLYSDLFRGQVKLDDLNFMQRQYIIEIELSEPISKDIYQLRYLTFNKMTQPVYQKIFITIMQHLSSKKRPLYMFDGRASEVLDFKTEEMLEGEENPLDELFEKLVIKDMSYPMIMKVRPRLECPPILLKGIILESFNRKVQVKGLGEFISLTDGLFNRPKLHIPHSQDTSLTALRESRQTLRPDQSESQYVALPVTNHELQARTASFNESIASQTGPNSKLFAGKSVMSSTGFIAGSRSPRRDRNINNSSLKKFDGSPSNRKSPTMKLNYDSASRIMLEDAQTSALVPCMQVKKITERQVPKTIIRKVEPVAPTKPINKQQFHIDPNLEKSIDCSFDALGSSEGRQSVNTTPPTSTKHHRQVRNMQRLSSSHIIASQIEQNDEMLDNMGDTMAHLSRKNLNLNSNMSEVDDEPNDTFGHSDRLQSIFTMKKKDSDLHDKVRDSLLLIQGPRSDIARITLKPNRSKDLHFKRNPEMQLQLKFPAQHDRQEFSQSKGILHISEQPLVQDDHEADSTPTLALEPSHKQDAAMSVNLDEHVLYTSGNNNHISSQAEVSSPKAQRVLRPVQKSIVNLIADDVIKEPVAPAKHKLQGLSHITKKTAMRRSNMRHALADEKSKKLLANDSKTHALHIQKKQIQENVSRVKSPYKRHQASLQEQQLADQKLGFKEFETVESEIQSMRRDSLASQFMANPNTEANLGPEVIIVNQTKKGHKISPRSRLQLPVNQSGVEPPKSPLKSIRFEKGGKQVDIELISDELHIKQVSRDGTQNGD